MTSRAARAGQAAPRTLTERQREVLSLVARGQTNFRVKYHLREIMARLDVGSREAAAERWKQQRGDGWKSARLFAALRPAALVAGASVAAVGVGLAVAALLGLGGDGPAAEPLPAEATAPGCTSPRSTATPDAQSTTDWSPFLRLNSVTYLPVGPESAPPGLQGMALGQQVGTVRWDVAAPGIDPCHAELDGAAALIPAGTPIYALRGYRPSFRVVVELATGERLLLEAQQNAKATTGADMLDIAGKVTTVEIGGIPWLEPYVEPPPAATVTDAATIRELEALVEAAPVGLVWIDVMPAMNLTFVLQDGSRVRRAFQRGEGLAYNIKVPDRVADIIARYVVFEWPSGKLIAR